MRRRAARGSALVAVIWLIAILAMVSVAALKVVSFDIDVAAARVHGFRAFQLAEMGVAVASNPAVEPGDPLLLRADEETGEGYEVLMTREGGKFNINAILASQDINFLKNLFISWGLDLEPAGVVADGLIDWVDDNDEVAMNGAERVWYEEQGRMNQPFNRPFYSLDEMRMVRGMELVEAYRPDWREWFTVWSAGGLDVNEAPAERIAAAAEVDVARAEVIPERVRGLDGVRFTEDDQPLQSVQEALALLGVDSSLRPDVGARFTINETTTRIESVGSVAGARRKIVLVLRNREGQPGILERKEEVVP